MNIFSDNDKVNSLIENIRNQYTLTNVVSEHEIKQIVNLAIKLTMEYDTSHDIYHHISVYHNSFIILDSLELELEETINEVARIVTYASLLHDTIDYKYNDTKEKEMILKEFLVGQLNDATAETIIWIINNISFSKEKQSGYPRQDQEVFVTKISRDIVSDADKIEALGSIGLERCFAYNKSKNPTMNDSEVTKMVVQHCYDKLLILHRYCITPKGKSIAVELTKDIENFVKCPF